MEVPVGGLPSIPWLEKDMSTSVNYERTADGDLAARVAHLVVGLIPMKDGSLRTLSAFTGKNPGDCNRADFHASGFHANDEDAFRSEIEDFAHHERQKSALGREEIPHALLKGFRTPWDTPDHGRIYASGIASVSTPSHGGFILTAEMNERIDERWRAPAGGYAGQADDVLDPEWRIRGNELPGFAFYEEDQQWAIVAVSFPELFTDREIGFANATLRNDYPDIWESVTGGTATAENSRGRRRSEFRSANAGRWLVTSAVKDRNDAKRVVVTAYKDGRDERGHTRGAGRHYSIDSEEYSRRLRDSGVYECVIDEANDPRVRQDGLPFGGAEAA